MDIRHVRAFIAALDEHAPPRIERARECLAALQRPDVRYLVASFLGEGATRVAAVTRAVVEAAGARTATLAPDARLSGAPLDDPLVARAGTRVADVALQLTSTRPELGELTRREAEVLLAFVAFAEASARVAVLVDGPVRPDDPIHAPVPDLVVLCALEGDALERALSLLPDARPLVLAEQAREAMDRAAAVAAERGLPVLRGGSDVTAAERDGATDVTVAGERYAGLPRAAGTSAVELATGVGAALALGVLGIRMREDWVVEGARAAARA